MIHRMLKVVGALLAMAVPTAAKPGSRGQETE
jgi:hypothetical protein